MPLRWGIIGVSKIAHDFYVALNSSLTNYEHKIVAIASNDIERSKEFKKSHLTICRTYGNYYEIGTDEEVDVVYVATLNSRHFELCKLMIMAGKHVLCEKPFCLNSQQVGEILRLAESKGVFVMEGIWSRFFPAYRYLSRLIDNGGLGQICEVYVKHGYKCENDNWITKKENGGGVVLNIGVYAIQFVLLVFQEAPKSIKATGKINKNGVDLYFEAEMLFTGGRKAKIICSGIDDFENQATIISRKGVICVPKYWCPTTIIAPDCTIRSWPLISSDIPLNYTDTVGLRYEADEVKKCIRSGKLHSDILPSKHMLMISQIEDEIRKQINVRYDCDR